MLAVIDNYDSFTYNLVQIVLSLGAETKVFRNDEITVEDLAQLDPRGLIVSPGPCSPNEAGISVESIRRFSGRIPVLGVCLGHQSMAVAFGGCVGPAQRIVHGKTSHVRYDDTPLYKGLPNPFPAGRYHSLAVLADGLPSDLVVDATADDGEIMGMHHRQRLSYGVQFHPESVLTPGGRRLLRNFMDIVEGKAA
jgi:anthranilate synthase/aminodeoxychorismate synthase-like glutamine amidotransferase